MTQPARKSPEDLRARKPKPAVPMQMPDMKAERRMLKVAMFLRYYQILLTRATKIASPSLKKRVVCRIMSKLILDKRSSMWFSIATFILFTRI